MYQVLLVDDEKMIRKSIRNRMDWEQYEVTVGGEAENGEEALRLMETLHPQIVLVDIRMPLMDGLAFIAEAKKHWPHVCYIIMSAYDDFEYAKQAIQLGVKDYILKPVIVDELEELIRKCVHELDKRRLVRRLKETAPGDEWLNLKGELLSVFAFYMEGQDEIELMLEAGVREVLEGYGQNPEVYYLEDYSCSSCYVFMANGKMLTEDQMERIAEKIWEKIGDMEGTLAWMAASDKKPDKLARQGITILKRKMFYPERKILSLRQTSGKSDAERSMQKDVRLKIRDELNFSHQYVMDKEYGQLEACLHRVTDLIVHKINKISFVEEVIAEILMFLKHLASDQEDETELNVMFHQFQGKDYLLRFKTGEELREALHDMSYRSLHTLKEQEDTDVIVAIRQYIKEHYADELNASEIARKFYLNASYLSAQFKEKTGMNMMAYIEGIRMEKAKEFLKFKDWNITEIASKTGYVGSNYFSRVFRKYVGMTPKQYRQSFAQIE